MTSTASTHSRTAAGSTPTSDCGSDAPSNITLPSLRSSLVRPSPLPGIPQDAAPRGGPDVTLEAPPNRGHGGVVVEPDKSHVRIHGSVGGDHHPSALLFVERGHGYLIVAVILGVTPTAVGGAGEA